MGGVYQTSRPPGRGGPAGRTDLPRGHGMAVFCPPGCEEFRQDSFLEPVCILPEAVGYCAQLWNDEAGAPPSW